MTYPLAAYACAACRCDLIRHPAGWACPECGVVGGKRVSKRRLAEQVVAATPPPLTPPAAPLATRWERNRR